MWRGLCGPRRVFGRQGECRGERGQGRTGGMQWQWGGSGSPSPPAKTLISPLAHTPPLSPPQVAFPIVDCKEDKAYAHSIRMQNLPTVHKFTPPPAHTLWSSPQVAFPKIMDSKEDEAYAHGMQMRVTHIHSSSCTFPLVTPTGGFPQHCGQQRRRGLLSRHANAVSPCSAHNHLSPPAHLPPPCQVAFPNIVDSKEDEAYAHGMQMRRLPTFQRIAEAQGQALLREGQGQVTIGRAEDQEGEPSPHGGAWDASGDRDLGGGSVGADSLARSGSGQGSRSGPAGSRTATDDASGSRGRFLNWISNVFAEDADPGRAGPSGSGGGGAGEGAKGKGAVRKSCR